MLNERYRKARVLFGLSDILLTALAFWAAYQTRAWLHLERLFLGRHKFHHFRIWYRDQLSGYLKQILLDPRALGRPCFDRRGLETMVLRHTRGEENYTRELHRALTCELTLRQLIDPA